MANWNYTNLKCNDLQRFAEIIKSNPFKWPHSGEAGIDKPVEIDNGTAYIYSKWCLPIDEIRKISKDNPDLIFTADYSLDSESYTTSNICTYQNGEELEYKVKANYSLIWKGNEDPEKYKSIMGNHYQQLYDRAIEIFRRMDIVKENEKGEKYIDFITGITLIIEDDDYQMELSKGKVYSSTAMQIKCSKKIKKTVTEKTEEIDIPFN